MRLHTLLLSGAVGAASALAATVLPASAVSPAPQPGPALVLERPLNGAAAIEALGDDLPDVAALNRTNATDLATRLRASH